MKILLSTRGASAIPASLGQLDHLPSLKSEAEVSFVVGGGGWFWCLFGLSTTVHQNPNPVIEYCYFQKFYQGQMQPRCL